MFSGPENYIKAANGDEFYVVTVAYYAEGIEGELNIDKSESIKFDFFYPNELPKNIVKSHKVILDEFLSKYYSYEGQTNR